MEFEGQVVLVTGSGKDIGKAIDKNFIQEVLPEVFLNCLNRSL